MAKVTVTEVTLRCYVHRRADGKWYAHCIDVSLDALGSSMEEAQTKLATAIKQYLDWTVEKGVPYRRPSPFKFQRTYFTCRAKLALRDLFHRDHHDGSTFTLAAA